MKFDAIITGGGLAGLMCGIRLAEAGKRCAIVSRGQSALLFSSGSLDLLSRLPDGQPVTDIRAGLETLSRQAPQHPYSLLGADRVFGYAADAAALLARCGLTLQGETALSHQRLTPLGTTRGAWLSPPEVPRQPLAWRDVTIAGIAGFLDFQPEFVASSLAKRGIVTRTAELQLPALDPLRLHAGEFRAVHIARNLEQPDVLAALVEELLPLARDTDALLMPACLGLEDDQQWHWLNQQLPCPLYLLPTLPPSVPGLRMQRALERRFRALGGTLMPGDEVRRITVNPGEPIAVETRNHGDITLRSQHVVLASGSFFSNGLIADRSGVREAIMGLDVAQSASRSDWYQTDFFKPQPWQQFGVQVDARLQPTLRGAAQPGLLAIGSVLAGYDPIAQGCGGGVCAVTALHAAERILGAGGTEL
ncbi:glycerol-3-phosphate dehydrogenase subunit GlpB [Entomohabitans teleogrylli]|uniref:glycerol-3-phosphate dehydrogenase subunit GlpB n=1 Tax=Entomohabitans teleogrylli TaxID=1384589 RepID=UPI00073D207B|nr:glycerol-3-phosphate dehydrogenase subunit GlpB [Entomohabitans teleogrylli]